MDALGDADAVERLAVVCDREAGRLEAIGRRWAEHLDQANWSCRRAEEFRAVVRSRRRDAEHHADDFRTLAVDLRHHADWIRNRTRQINAVERAVRGWLADNAPKPGEVARWAGWGVPTHLPGSGDPAWETLARRMRGWGADC